MKIVIVLLALLLLVWLLLGSARRRAKESRRDAPPPSAKPEGQIEGMVACAHCGVHLPASLALLGQGRPYCSAAHRDGGPRAT